MFTSIHLVAVLCKHGREQSDSDIAVIWMQIPTSLGPKKKKKVQDIRISFVWRLSDEIFDF